MIKIIVNSEEEKIQLIQASVHIHDSEVDTDLPMVNAIAHLYLNPDMIEVKSPSVAELLANKRGTFVLV